MASPEATDKTIDGLIAAIERFLASQFKISGEGLLAWQRENTPRGLAPFGRLAELLPAAREERRLRTKLALVLGAEDESRQTENRLNLHPNDIPNREKWENLATSKALNNADWGASIYVRYSDPLNRKRTVSSLIYEYRQGDSVTYRARRKQGHEIILEAALIRNTDQPLVCRRTELTICHKLPTPNFNKSFNLKQDPRFPFTTLLAFEKIALFTLGCHQRLGSKSKVLPHRPNGMEIS